MDTYKGFIYYSSGRREETGGFSGPMADRSCEKYTAELFARRQRESAAYRDKPTRFEVKKVS